MSKLNRKEKLQKQNRHKERVASWKQRTIRNEEMEAESRRVFDSLPPDEQNILLQLSGFLQESGISAQKITFPTEKFFEIAEITDLNQKRSVYVLWNTGIFTDRIDKPPIQMKLDDLLVTWWITTLDYNLPPDDSLRPSASTLSNMLSSIDALVEKIPGFDFCCPYDQTMFPRGVELVFAEFSYATLPEVNADSPEQTPAGLTEGTES